MGIEALSRGARLAIFVEIDRKSVQCIRENLELLKFDDRTEVYNLPADRALKILSKKQAKFDIIFLGAPYGSPELNKCLTLIGSAELLNESGVVIAEHRTKTKLESQYGRLIQVREERYGDTTFTFYEDSSISRKL